MKKAIFILLSLVLTSGLCYAAEQGGAAKISKPSASMTMNTAPGYY